MKTLLIGGVLAILLFHFYPARAQAQQPSPNAPQAANCYNLMPAPFCDLWFDTWNWATAPPTEWRCDQACHYSYFPEDQAGDGDDWGDVEPNRWEDPD